MTKIKVFKTAAVVTDEDGRVRVDLKRFPCAKPHRHNLDVAGRIQRFREDYPELPVALDDYRPRHRAEA